jgi:hypothetical protein
VLLRWRSVEGVALAERVAAARDEAVVELRTLAATGGPSTGPAAELVTTLRRLAVQLPPVPEPTPAPACPDRSGGLRDSVWLRPAAVVSGAASDTPFLD